MTTAGLFTEKSQPPGDRNDAELPLVPAATAEAMQESMLPAGATLIIDRIGGLVEGAAAFRDFKFALDNKDWPRLEAAAHRLTELDLDFGGLARQLSKLVSASRPRPSRTPAEFGSRTKE